jgi:hypothetical protein
VPVAFRPSEWGVPKLLGALFTAGFLLGCGIQGPPQPPHLERPEQVTDFQATQVGRAIEMRFTPPELTVDGERLRKPLEIEILRDVTPAGARAPSMSPTTPWVALSPEEWHRRLQGAQVVFSVSLSGQQFALGQGVTLVLAVRTLTRGFRHHRLESALSNIVQVPLLDVPGAVQNLVLRTTEKAIEVRWTPPDRSLSGRPLHTLAGYRIYRSRTGKPDSFQLRAEVQAPPYLDDEFEFGQAYFYNVRAVFNETGKTAESEDSRVVGIRPLDIFPPAAPEGLTALYTAGAVDLVWNANRERDLAGYNVYRRESQGQMKRLNQELVRTPIFRDQTVEPGHSYLYHISAVDLTGNESRPSGEVSAETR